jgi:hypothetical protein
MTPADAEQCFTFVGINLLALLVTTSLSAKVRRVDRRLTEWKPMPYSSVIVITCHVS